VFAKALCWCETDEGHSLEIWGAGEKKVTLYFWGHDIEYLKSWGPVKETHFEDGECSTFADLKDLMNWVMK
jgi:hypothetical protein